MVRLEPADRVAAVDMLCLAAISLISAAPYLPKLGFYSDDWSLLASFHAAAQHGQSLIGPALSVFDARPVQGLYEALLFALFGFDPLPYHLVNTVVIATSVSLLYLLLLRLRFDRAESFAISLVFLMLPQLSTVRVWYAAFQVPLSLALTLMSMHAQLSFVQSRRGAWLAVAVLSALLAISAYEIFAPLIALFVAGIAFVAWWDRRTTRERSWRTEAVLALAILAAVAVSAAYKIAVSERTGPIGRPSHYAWVLLELVRPDYDWRIDGGLNVFAAALVHFWFTVKGWGDGAAALLSGQLGLTATAAAAAVAGCALWRLLLRTDSAEYRNAVRLLAAGLVVFLAGHTAFLIVPFIAFAPTGIGNRVLVAAAIGVAMIFVSVIAFLAGLAPRSVRQKAFAIAVTGVTVVAFARIIAIERYWTEVPAITRQILAAAKADLRQLPAGSTIILDGICPYHGPAVVFETWWDIGDAFSLALGKPIQGDMVSPRLEVGPAGITTSIYNEPRHYAYGRSLYVYNLTDHLLVPLTDAAAATSYFEGRAPLRCPPGYPGHGIAV